MVVADLDNTLLRSDKSISEYSKSVLTRCRAQGTKVVFATARSTQAASRFTGMFEPDAFIGYGGALAYAGDTVICRMDIPAGLSYQLINECLREPEISTVLAINETAAHTNRLDMLDTASSHYEITDFTVKNDLSYLKISVIASNPETVARIASRYPTCDVLRYSGEDIYRFANRNAVKWNAVRFVADFYKISTNSIVAFGDDVNDLEMIEFCGVGVAMANAVDEVKAVADHICDTNDNDGLAKWLELYVL